MYADWTFYSERFCGKYPRSVIDPKLSQAADDVDILTFSRIHAIHWEKLTDRQREIVQCVCCLQAEFLAENADAVGSPFKSYSINGVSMEFGNSSLYRVIGGIAISQRAYKLLQQSGLTSLCAAPQEVYHAIP